MTTRDSLGKLAIISVLGIASIILILVIITIKGALGLGEFVIGSGTFLLAMATFYLAYAEKVENTYNREQDRELAEKDRRRMRLKEQLEGLYSPLMSCIDLFEHLRAHQSEPILSLMQKLRGKVEFLAENELKEFLREYYYIDFRVISKTDWDEFIVPMKDAIGMGWAYISDEYDDLTRKVT